MNMNKVFYLKRAVIDIEPNIYFFKFIPSNQTHDDDQQDMQTHFFHM